MTGVMTFSSSCPAWAASAIAWSAPMTWNETMESISAMTGLTLPGMMEEPGWRAGSVISARPVFGPEARSLKSPDIFTRSTQRSFMAPERAAKSDMKERAANVSLAFSSPFMPVAFLNSARAVSLYLRCVLMPVPTAVAPSPTS